MSFPCLKLGPFWLGRPTEQDVKAVADECPRLPFNFPYVGVTKSAPPLKQAEELRSGGWAVGHNRVQVGRGRAAYRRAQDLLQRWQHFHLGWATVNDPPVRKGAGVVVVARSLLLWTCNPLRISYVEEGAARLRRAGGGEGRRFAFGHTTLKGHQISGEERFAVEWHPQDDSVWFDIFTVSKPATPIAMLAQPLLRHYQRRFVAESMAAMQAQLAPAPPPDARRRAGGG